MDLTSATGVHTGHKLSSWDRPSASVEERIIRPRGQDVIANRRSHQEIGREQLTGSTVSVFVSVGSPNPIGRR
jgi:hypothetical protein